MKLLILGANGFIGSHLCDHILRNQPGWKITALDLNDSNLSHYANHPNLSFRKGNLIHEHAWLDEQVKACDVVLPLAAIATPAVYVKDPIAVFELDFEANLSIVRLCTKYKKRIVFPSTSEVYGMSPDVPYDEEESLFVTGPIHKERWIYATCKQLIDRVIYAHGTRDGLPFTLFRPFNWFGPRLDDISQKGASSRVVTQFLRSILHDEPITLVDGGAQKRCFLYIDDAIDALMRIIENRNDCATGRIFNIGDPQKEFSIRELAEMLLDTTSQFPGYGDIKKRVKLVEAKGTDYYGLGYQDTSARIPSIKRARELLGWEPKTDMKSALKATVAQSLAGRP